MKRDVEVLFLLAAIILFSAIILFFRVIDSGVYSPFLTIGQTMETSSSSVLSPHPLTGLEMAEGESEKPAVFAVVIDNNYESWPLSGLDQAFLVFETLAEGQIPRLLAFFYSDQKVEKIGPVRSARPYFVSWTFPYRTIFAHVGGSPEAISFLQNADRLVDLDQFYADEYFWRSFDRWPPFNVYTSVEKLRQAWAALTSAKEDVVSLGWSRKEERPLNERPTEGETAQADFGSPIYVVAWRYDRETNLYHRYQGGEPTVSEDGVVVSSENIIVMSTEMKVIDAVGRRWIKTVGEGRAVVYQDGLATPAIWRRSSEEEPIEWRTESGQTVHFNPGRIWIEVVPL